MKIQLQFDEVKNIFIREQYSRIPVYHEDKDHIIGIIYERDFFEAMAKNIELKNVKQLMRNVLFVNKKMTVDGKLSPARGLCRNVFELRKDKGVTAEDALKQMHNYNYFGTMMIKAGDADGMLSGANHSTADTVRPALQIIKSAHKDRGVSAALISVKDGEAYLLSDCAVVIDPTDKELSDIALTSAETAIQFGIEPKIAMLSYSTRGSGSGGMVDKVRNATKLAQEMLQFEEYKNLPIMIDGEMQADAALDSVVARKKRRIRKSPVRQTS